MANDFIHIHNAVTDEVIVRELSDSEQAELDAHRLAAKEKAEADKAEVEAKVVQRQALLDKLGITEEEARLLLGGN